MEGHVEPGAYKDVVLFLVTAGVVVPLFRQWRISPILGFLGAGVLLGPYGLGALAREATWLSALTIDNPAEVAQLAEFGVVFLLFMIGLELSWERLKSLRRYVFGLGGLQVGLCLSATGGTALLLGQPPLAALAIGAALALSSTAIVMPILAEQKRQHAMAGRATFSVLLFQDLAVAPILVTMTLLQPQTEGAAAPNLLLTFLPAVVGIAALFAFGRLLLRPMLRSVARAKSEELFVAACLLVVIGAGLVSAITGLSMALGAFIAGLLLAETEFRHEVEVVIEPFKGLLLGLFFVSVGIGLNVPLLLERPLVIVGSAVGWWRPTARSSSSWPRLRPEDPQRHRGGAAAGRGRGVRVRHPGPGHEPGPGGPRGRRDGAGGRDAVDVLHPFLAQLGLKLGGRRIQPAELPVEPAGERPPSRGCWSWAMAASGGWWATCCAPRHRLGGRRARLQAGRAGPPGRQDDLLRRRRAEEFLLRCGLAERRPWW
jgi:CPA2 family monovalent cation:H+ antiporter-2